ncbi:Lipoprotein signal peptidase [invertebrate metagenome]|uniref:Lipoprotein signal peptidase n=1 Tax=invertebrate metagenome TaxID=1711999 RepID=A0A484H6I7_9ZZZZ
MTGAPRRPTLELWSNQNSLTLIEEWHIFSLSLAMIILLTDQISKEWVLTQLTASPQILKVTPFFNVVLTGNRGISFGIFNNDTPYTAHIFAALSGIVVVGLLVWLQYVCIVRVRLALGAIIGGAIGNALDRLRHDSVVDFLDFHLGGLHWPAFNVADLAITIGAVVLTRDAFCHHSSEGR